MSAPSTAGRNSGCSARVIGIGWTLFSLGFVVFGLWSIWGGMSESRWKEMPCTIGKFEIVLSPKEPSFRPDLSFAYEYGGQHYKGTRLWASGEGTDDYEKLSAIREPLFMGPEGMRSSLDGVATTCWVNPHNPAEAILKFDRTEKFVLGAIFTILGSVFTMIGLSLSFGSLSVTTYSPAKNAPGVIGTGVSIALFGLFAMAGLGLLMGVVVPKARDWFAMRHWQETTAEIISSRVGSHRGSKGGTTYSIDLLYRYDFKGREYRSDRYNLMGGNSSGYDGKAAVVKIHPRGSKLQVFVDPEKPWRAIVKRGAGWGALFVLFPLAFMAVGFGGIWGVLRKKTASSSARSDPAVSASAQGMLSYDKAALVGGKWERMRRKPGGQVLGLVFAALFWNGIISIFIREDIRLYQQGSFPMAIFLSLFLTPFVVIGLVIVFGAGQQFILLFGPAYEIQLEQAELRPGESTRLRWRRSGGRGTVQDFQLLLVGSEEVWSDGGARSKRPRQWKSVFHEEVLSETSISLATAQGQAELKIPADAVPSLVAAGCSIRWRICLRAKVAGMPTIRDERNLHVCPPQSPS